MTELASSGPPDPDSLAALTAEHGLVFGNAPWLEDVIARYHLTPRAPLSGLPQPGDLLPGAGRSLCALEGADAASRTPTTTKGLDRPVMDLALTVRGSGQPTACPPA